MEKEFIGRSIELKSLNDFIKSPGAGFTYLTGRRRIGKSWLLKEYQDKHKNVFYFTGAEDESIVESKARFLHLWADFTKDSIYHDIDSNQTSWKKLFSYINTFTQVRSKEKIVLVLDEIQWLAKKNSGFGGLLKEAWIDWEKRENLKVIICGSSRKFFQEKTGGDEQILRGIKTHAGIEINDFSLREIKKYFFTTWSEEEICFFYMMFGGVPYYISQLLDYQHEGFISAVNKQVFTKSTIFLSEVTEILKLEFNKKGILTIIKILASLGLDGQTISKIHLNTGISESTVSVCINKLLDYSIVFEKIPAGTTPIKNQAGYRYFMRDPFLNFYFQVLQALEYKIKENVKGLIFPYQVLGNGKHFYISNFSGKAFELLIRNILETRNIQNSKLFEELNIGDVNYNVLSYWDANTEIDLIVEHLGDRVARIIECKWGSAENIIDKSVLNKLISKTYKCPNKFQFKYYLITSGKVGDALKNYAKSIGIKIIMLESLF